GGPFPGGSGAGVNEVLSPDRVLQEPRSQRVQNQIDVWGDRKAEEQTDGVLRGLYGVPGAPGEIEDIARLKFDGVGSPRHLFRQWDIAIEVHLDRRFVSCHPIVERGPRVAIWEHAPSLGSPQLNREIFERIEMASRAGSTPRRENAASQGRL